MKICPKCNQTFADDNSFCLMDGTTLVIESEEQNTIPSFTTDSNAPTQFISPPVTTAGQVPVNTIPGWVYMIIGVMGTALIALVAFIFLLQGGKDDPTTVSTTNTEVKKESVNETNRNANETALDIKERPAKQTVLPETSKAKEEEPKLPEVDPNFSPSGNWSGDWNSKSTSYVATAYLNESNGKIDGQINWTLKRTKNPKKINKVGSSATEYVRGTFNPRTGKIFLRGYRKKDPQNIVILDRYNLSLSKNNQQISGKSINGRFILRR
jgi:hypothetical protein